MEMAVSGAGDSAEHSFLSIPVSPTVFEAANEAVEINGLLPMFAELAVALLTVADWFGGSEEKKSTDGDCSCRSLLANVVFVLSAGDNCSLPSPTAIGANCGTLRTIRKGGGFGGSMGTADAEEITEDCCC